MKIVSKAGSMTKGTRKRNPKRLNTARSTYEIKQK
jgi:hypothetical protein